MPALSRGGADLNAKFTFSNPITANFPPHRSDTAQTGLDGVRAPVHGVAVWTKETGNDIRKTSKTLGTCFNRRSQSFGIHEHLPKRLHSLENMKPKLANTISPTGSAYTSQDDLSGTQ
jgi:hypothetical protein